MSDPGGFLHCAAQRGKRAPWDRDSSSCLSWPRKPSSARPVAARSAAASAACSPAFCRSQRRCAITNTRVEPVSRRDPAVQSAEYRVRIVDLLAQTMRKHCREAESARDG